MKNTKKVTRAKLFIEGLERPQAAILKDTATTMALGEECDCGVTTLAVGEESDKK